MERKKVKKEEIKSPTTKKRVVKKTPNKTTSNRWDKIEGVQGKIVRHTVDDEVKSKEISELISKKKARSLYYGIDGDQFYFYYEIL